jgi:hypothetical protein
LSLPLDDEIRLRVEKEIEDTEFRLKRGSDLGSGSISFGTLFECRYSRWKPLVITCSERKQKHHPHYFLRFWLSCQLFSGYGRLRYLGTRQCFFSDLRPQALQVRHLGSNNDLITIAKEIRLKLDSFSTYIFTQARGSDMYHLPDRLANNAIVIISFVPPNIWQKAYTDLEHSGKEGAPLEVTLGSTIIQLNPFV